MLYNVTINRVQMEEKMTYDKVKEMVASQLNIDAGKITPESRLVEDLGADSLDMIEMLMSLEEEFKITVPDEDAEKLLTVGSIAAYIDAKNN